MIEIKLKNCNKKIIDIINENNLNIEDHNNIINNRKII